MEGPGPEIQEIYSSVVLTTFILCVALAYTLSFREGNPIPVNDLTVHCT